MVNKYSGLGSREVLVFEDKKDRKLGTARRRGWGRGYNNRKKMKTESLSSAPAIFSWCYLDLSTFDKHSSGPQNQSMAPKTKTEIRWDQVQDVNFSNILFPGSDYEQRFGGPSGCPLCLLTIDSWFYFWEQKPRLSCEPLAPSITQWIACNWSHELFGDVWPNGSSDRYFSLPRMGMTRDDTRTNYFNNAIEGK